MNRIIDGDRPVRPTLQSGLCVIPPSDTIWSLITRCWDHIPDSCPTMPEVLDHLKVAHRKSSSFEPDLLEALVLLVLALFLAGSLESTEALAGISKSRRDIDAPGVDVRRFLWLW
jgi:hypothetical protein